jgi:hypothetical protein
MSMLESTIFSRHETIDHALNAQLTILGLDTYIH